VNELKEQITYALLVGELPMKSVGVFR